MGQEKLRSGHFEEIFLKGVAAKSMQEGGGGLFSIPSKNVEQLKQRLQLRNFSDKRKSDGK